MMVLHWVRGGLALGVVLLWLALAGLPSILLLSLPARVVARERRLAWVSTWARLHCGFVLALLHRLGGARFVREGAIPSDRPGLILMNHQSVLDIPTAILMCGPLVPAFIARARYAQVPMIATGLWLAECPVIDPGRDREAALLALAQAVQRDRALLIYPEGHRTPDGALQPFRTAGLLAILGARRVPVWLLATDGFWAGRRLVDLVKVARMRGLTEVLGPFAPPEDEAALPTFLDEMHARLREHLAEGRARRKEGAS